MNNDVNSQEMQLPLAILTEDINRVKCPTCGRTVRVCPGEGGEKDCPYCENKFMLPMDECEELSDEDFVDLVCPSCGNTVSVDVALDEHCVVCPFCDEKIEY